MRPGEPAAFEPLPTLTPEDREGLFTALAARVAGRAELTGVLVESEWGVPGRVRLLGVPDHLVQDLPVRPVAPGPAWVPPGSARGVDRLLTIGTIARAPDAEDPSRARWRSGPHPLATAGIQDAPPPAAARPSDWTGSQTHWSAAGDGQLEFALRIWSRREGAAPARPAGLGSALDRLPGIVGSYLAVEFPLRRRFEREWSTGAWVRFRPRHRFRGSPTLAARLALLGAAAPPAAPEAEGHTIVFGASGAGKTRYLAAVGRERFRAGGAVVGIDVHGDLAPRLVGGLAPGELARVIAIDPTLGGRPPGLSPFSSVPGSEDASRAHLLGALRRVGAEDAGPFWGFRLDRIFDTMARIVQEEDGGLTDLYELLVDPARRDVARTRTRSPTIARFLDELPAILRRNPEFLWPAAARLSRLMLAPPLAALVVPGPDELPIGALLAERRMVLWRLPIGAVGSEGAHLLSTLLLARTYLGLVAGGPAPPGPVPPVTVLLDEAHLLAPRLLTEMLTEGRKFGLSLLVATQYPERLEREARAAAAGAAAAHVLFRVPRAHAGELATWIGIPPEEAVRLLAGLPTGRALRVRGGPGGELERIETNPEVEEPPERWPGLVAASQRRYSSPEEEGEQFLGDEEERVLLALLAREEYGRPTTTPELARELEGSVDPERVDALVPSLAARGDLELAGERIRLGPLGRAHLGFEARTGATRESAEHRALLLESFRLFARHGLKLEILRQGRFDTRLPDARVGWIGPRERAGAPHELRAALARAEASFGYRLAGGRDIFVEAEVSGARRPERIRRGLAKARSQGAFVLFVVGDPDRARCVRRALAGRARGDAAVWVLRRARTPGTAPG